MTALTDEQLMEQYTKQIAWQNFFATQVAEAEVAEAEAEADWEYRKTLAMLNAGGGGAKTVTQQRLERDATKEVQKAREDYLVAKARRKLLSVTMDNRERCSALLSRELTRRLGRESGERRQSRFRP